MSSWRVITRDELQRLIDESLASASVEERRIFDLIAVAPEKWRLPPWGDEGGGFWVVAVLGRWVVWYNDIEEGFNVSAFVQWGAIDDYACDKLELHHWLLRIGDSIAQDRAFPGSRSGAPEPMG